MEIIPAVDLRGGRCVRLLQGDYDKETVFSDDPVATARRWAEQGAPRLHVADLDGAREGRPVNAGAIERILAAVQTPVQVSGGVRDLETVQRWLDAGADRVVLGTAAAREPELARAAAERFGDRVLVSVDARNGFVAIEGWIEAIEQRADDLLARLASLGVRRFVYTDIARDGTLTSPNFEAIETIVRAIDAPVIAAGGVAATAHLVRLAQIGVEGAIVGRALYEGRIDLPQALTAVDALRALE